MRKVILILAFFLTGCAATTAVVDKENLPEVKTVVVVAYENQTQYDCLTDAVREGLESKLADIASPIFIPYEDASLAVGEVTREMLSDPAKLEEFKRLNADAFLFCTIVSASIPEAAGGDVSVNPLGCIFGHADIRYTPPPSVKVTASVDIISLETGLPLYSNTFTGKIKREKLPDEELLKRASEYWAEHIMEGYYKWRAEDEYEEIM